MTDHDDDDDNIKERKRRSDSTTPVLDNFSRDLLKLAEEGKLDPVIGREKEINRIAMILSRRKKNNPVIIGEPGCGKTAIVEGLAMKIFNGNCPRNLSEKRIVSLDLNSLVAGTKYRGQFEERLKVILEELNNNPNIVIFIDEIHTIVGAGNSSGALDASNILKPALARGEIQCIGATTLDEYRQSFEKDGALERRFQKIVVDSATKEETLEILKQLKDKYEAYHKVIYNDEVLSACVLLADRYITDREFPDKALDVMDEVGAKSQIEIKMPKIIDELNNQATEVKKEKLEVVRKQDYEKAAELRDKEKKVLVKLENEKKKFDQELIDKRKEIPIELVYDVVSAMTKIPINKLSVDDSKNLLDLESKLSKSIIGQSEAISKISKCIRRNRLGIKEAGKPWGSFICLGSSGVGKTLLAKQLAKEIFGTEEALIRVDMSEYQEKHTVSRLLGAPPGYVGYDEGGQLTEKVKNKPYCVILFDEIEKAHKDIFHSLLQIIDEGHLTDGLGRKINFKNCLIIMTSNLGVKKLQDFGTGIGFVKSVYGEEEARKEILKKELKAFLNPEFINRLDDIIIFNNLKKDEIKQIVEIEINKLQKRLVTMKYDFNFDSSVINMIADVGYDEIYGARPMKRAIQDKIEDYLSEEILRGNLKEGIKYDVNYSDNKICVKED